MTAEPANSEPVNLAERDLRTGQKAFESGQYRSAVRALEKSLAAADPGTKLHGEAMIWLVTAYEAAGDRQRAKDLCQLAAAHPSWETRKEGKRLQYILDAPVLRRREDWVTKIPDLEELDETKNEKNWGGSKFQSSTPRRPIVEDKGYKIPPPTDLSQVETEDGGFVWVVLVTIGLVTAGLAWLAMTG